MFIIVGSIIKVNIMIAASRLLPGGARRVLIKGTITTRPKKPYTTDGIPARSSIAGLNSLTITAGAISERKIAVNIPISIPANTEPRVASRDAATMGKIPNDASPFAEVGFHSLPKTKLKNPILNIIGVPLIKI